MALKLYIEGHSFFLKLQHLHPIGPYRWQSMQVAHNHLPPDFFGELQKKEKTFKNIQKSPTSYIFQLNITYISCSRNILLNIQIGFGPREKVTSSVCTEVQLAAMNNANDIRKHNFLLLLKTEITWVAFLQLPRNREP